MVPDSCELRDTPSRLTVKDDWAESIVSGMIWACVTDVRIPTSETRAVNKTVFMAGIENRVFDQRGKLRSHSDTQ